MKIVLINDAAKEDNGCEPTLERYGHLVIASCGSDENFSHTVIRHKPDLLLLRLVQVNDRILNNIFLLQREYPLPVLLFADRSSPQDMNNILSAGVSAYVIDGYDTERLPALIDVAKARFKQIKNLHEELRDVKQSLEDRRLIERAKGIIMKKQGLNEEQAYMLLRKAAMNQSKKIVEVARSIIGLANVLI